MKITKDSLNEVCVEMKYEVKIEWLNFIIFKYIDTISYTKFKVRDLYFDLKYNGKDGYLEVRMQYDNLAKGASIFTKKRFVNEATELSNIYLTKLFELSYDSDKEVKLEMKPDISILINIVEKEKIIGEVIKYSCLEEYFNEIDEFIAGLSVDKEKFRFCS